MRRCASVACLTQLRYGQVSREANSRALVVFSKTTCPFCEEAKGVLQGELGAAYAAIKVIELDQLGPAAPRRELSSALLALTGMSTVPNIFLEGESLGGCSELKALLSSEPDRVRARLLAAGACTVRVGDRVPSAQVKVVEAGEDGAARVRDVDSAELVRGQTVLELGAGAGLVALAAARLGARTVLATDLPRALPLLIHNLQLNGGRDVCVVTPRHRYQAE